MRSNFIGKKNWYIIIEGTKQTNNILLEYIMFQYDK